jgi:phosphoribosylformylglycinamidine synthase
VAEAARNLICRGAEPIAVTDCLNFGNPEKPEVYWELSEAIDGLAEACTTLEIPIVSGNVSLYNESTSSDGSKVAVKPSPIVGMVGLIEDRSKIPSSGFVAEGDVVLLLDMSPPPSMADWLVPPMALDLKREEDRRQFLTEAARRWRERAIQDVGCSEYLSLLLGRSDDLGPPPVLDLDRAVDLERFVLEAIHRGLVRSAHDCAEGGLAVTIAESCIEGNIGFAFSGYDDLNGPPRPPRLDAELFGESQSRVVLSCKPEDAAALEAMLPELGVLGMLVVLGRVGGDRLTWSDDLNVSVEELARAWNTPF